MLCLLFKVSEAMSRSLLLADLFDHLLEFGVRHALLVFVIQVIYHLYHYFVFVMALKHQLHLS